MSRAFVQILREVPQRLETDDWWTLHFQKVVYHYNDREPEEGYRFIWRRPDGSLQAARGQARIPGRQEIADLLEQAEKAGLFI